MDEAKKWYQSKTIAGIVVILLVAIANLAGIVIDPDTQTQLVDLLVAGGTVVGGFFAIYGRIKATKQIE